MSEEKTYQPGWGEEPKRHHRHHHHHSSSGKADKSKLGDLRRRDKQAYYGVLCVIVIGIVFGVYKFGKWLYSEFHDMPFDTPETELSVDELRIKKVAEQDALLMGDSLAQAYALDSIKHTVQIETVPVYRPPKKENTWYITLRDWKAIKRNYKVWRWEKKREQEKEQNQ